jgi:Anthranilate/para-aminobenzoate synthases component I
MLPAGSITGAPKIKTTQIILDAENYDRGYYSGVFGVFDGCNLDSAVMIRFIEETERGLVFKSGGGITAKSNLDDEYNEMKAKVYVPATGKY